MNQDDYVPPHRIDGPRAPSRHNILDKITRNHGLLLLFLPREAPVRGISRPGFERGGHGTEVDQVLMIRASSPRRVGSPELGLDLHHLRFSLYLIAFPQRSDTGSEPRHCPTTSCTLSQMILVT
jgi:hypothetical protein